MSASDRFVVLCAENAIRALNFSLERPTRKLRSSSNHKCGLVPGLSKDEARSAKTITADALTLEGLNRFDFARNATPMWVFDISTLVFSAVNDAAVRHYCYSRKEFLSMTILDIRPGKDIPSLLREVLQKQVLNPRNFGKTKIRMALDRRGGHALRSTLQRMHRRHRDRRRCMEICRCAAASLGSLCSTPGHEHPPEEEFFDLKCTDMALKHFPRLIL